MATARLTQEGTTPSAPATGSSLIYPKTGGGWFYRDAGGAEHQLVGGEGSTLDGVPNGSVTAAMLASNAVETAKILDGAVTAGKLGAGAVGAAALASNAVETAKIADGNVTGAKLAALWVNTSRPAFEARRTTTQSSVADDGILICNTEVYDQGSNYNPTTGIFTAPVAGIYLFSWTQGGGSPSSTTLFVGSSRWGDEEQCVAADVGRLAWAGTVRLTNGQEVSFRNASGLTSNFTPTSTTPAIFTGVLLT